MKEQASYEEVLTNWVSLDGFEPSILVYETKNFPIILNDRLIPAPKRGFEPPASRLTV